MPSNSAIKGQVGVPSTPPTAEQLEEGRRLGALIATDLVTDIEATGFRRSRRARVVAERLLRDLCRRASCPNQQGEQKER